MRKIIFTLLGAFISLISFTQTTSEHLTFKGIPIDGTLNEYIAKMKQAKFTLIETTDGVALLSGEFAGYQDCIIGVKTLKNII